MPDPAHVERLSQISEALLQAAELVANDTAEETNGGLQIQAVALMIKCEGEWGATQIAGPEEWGPKEEVEFLMTAVQQYIKALGGNVTVTVQDPNDAVRPLPRRRRARPRR